MLAKSSHHNQQEVVVHLQNVAKFGSFGLD